MSTFHATTPGNASSSSTWAEHAVPGPTDHWTIEAQTHIDSGLPSGTDGCPELDSGGELEIQAHCILDADATFQVNAGASIVFDSTLAYLQVLGYLQIDGGTFDNTAGGALLGDSGTAALYVWNDALLINPTTFFSGEWFPQFLINGDTGDNSPQSVRIQYTTWAPPAAATYFAPAEVVATVQNGATLDFATRDDTGAVNDPDFLPTIPVTQQGALAGVTVTLRRNNTGSYTASFATPTPDTTYYVPICWTIAGNNYVQEFRVVVASFDVAGKVLGGGSSALAAAGVITANPATTVSITSENTTIRSN